MGVVFAILALSGVVWLAQNWRGGRALLSVNGIVANASIAIAIAWPLMVWKGGKRARCIAILPAGVLVRTHEVRRLVAWTELVGASMFERRIRDSGDDCGVRLTLDDGTTVEAIGVFASDLERGEFLSRTQARIAGVDE